MNKTWLGLSFVFGLALMLATPVLAGFQEGVDAYERGDYETALKKFLPLAEQGHAGAQNHLGELYAEGKGVPQDYTEAMQWYRAWRRTREMHGHSPTWGGCTARGKACRRIMRRR